MSVLRVGRDFLRVGAVLNESVKFDVELHVLFFGNL